MVQAVLDTCEEDEEPSDGEDFTFSVLYLCAANQGGQGAQLVQRCPKGIVPIGGVSMRVLLDSGAVSNLMGEDELTALRAKGLVVCEQPRERILLAYGG